MSESESQARRRRWINLGEFIAVLALIVSAAGVWVSWKSSTDKPAQLVEQHKPIPLTLRGTVDSDGRVLTIIPADPAHALESLTVTIKGASPIQVGSDGRLDASDVEAALKSREKELKDHVYSVPVQIAAHYVESGVDRHGGGIYVLRYRWEGGGLFGSRSLHLIGLSR
jgi:hypothetical protein